MKNFSFFIIAFAAMAIASLCPSCSSESYEGVKPVTVDIYEVHDAASLLPIVAELNLPAGVSAAASPYTLLCARNSAVRDEVDELFAADSVATKLPADVKLCWSKKTLGGAGYELYALKTDSDGNCALGGSHVTGAKANDDECSLTISYDKEGAEMIKRISADNIGRALAIVAADRVYWAPRVNDIIESDKLIMTSGIEDESIEALARSINAGIAASQSVK